MKKCTLILSVCAMAAALTLGTTPAMARSGHDDHGRDGRHGYHHGKHYTKHAKKDHHWRNSHRDYRPKTVVNFSYGWPNYFSYGTYYPRPVAYYHPQPVHYHTPYCHHW